MRTAGKWEKGTRRARVYTGRVRRMVFGKGVSDPCLFVHMPKCGGTSLSEALYAAVALQHRIGVIDALSTRRAAAVLAFDKDDPLLCHEDLPHGDRTFALREQILMAHRFWGTRLIHGHVLYSDLVRKHFAGQYRLVTIMRHPIERALSNFRMASHAGVVSPDVDAWLDGQVGLNHAAVYLRYLTGHASVSPEEVSGLMPRAMAAIEEFDLVGFLDRTDAFVSAFEARFGPRLAIPRSNQARGEPIELDAGQQRRLEALCAPDIEIYERARARFPA